MPSSTRLLVTGDLHLGRFPTRVPDDDRLSVKSVWFRIVDFAINERVDAVVLTGDIANADNQFFEAIGPLESGLRRLADAMIPVFAVSGNHDHEVLPRLAKTLGPDHFRLLGQGGSWEVVPLVRNGETVLHFLGWSFPRKRVRENALDDIPTLPEGKPVLGMLHADLDATESPYNPVTRADLIRTPVDCWLLGHIHGSRNIEEGGTTILYPGSPQPLDPGETGVHGACLVEVDKSGHVEVAKVRLASLVYVSLSADLSLVDSSADLESYLANILHQHVRKTIKGYDDMVFVSVRLTVSGRTGHYRHLPEILNRLKDEWEYDSGGVSGLVEKINNETRPALNLEHIARGQDPPAVVARFLLELSNLELTEGHSEIIQSVRKKVNEINGRRVFLGVRSLIEAENGPPASELLRNAAWKLLDSLVKQKEERDSHD